MRGMLNYKSKSIEYCNSREVYYYSSSGLLYRMHTNKFLNRKKRINHMKRSKSVYRRLKLCYYGLNYEN